MKYTKLEKSNIEVSTVGLGTNAVSGHNLSFSREAPPSNLIREVLNHLSMEMLMVGQLFFLQKFSN